MKTLLIDGIANITEEGVTLHFNEKFSLNGSITTNEWWVSWDKIGEALCGGEYCEETSVNERNKTRKEKAVYVTMRPKTNEIPDSVIQKIKREENLSNGMRNIYDEFGIDIHLPAPPTQLDALVKEVAKLRNENFNNR